MERRFQGGGSSPPRPSVTAAQRRRLATLDRRFDDTRKRLTIAWGLRSKTPRAVSLRLKLELIDGQRKALRMVMKGY